MLIEEHALFFDEVKRLDNFEEWHQVERDVRLCRSLRATGREMSILGERLKNMIALRNKEKFSFNVFNILEVGERELADLIADSLYKLVIKAEKTPEDSEGYKKLKRAVKKMRDTFRKERMKLISAELEFFKQI